MSEEMTPHNDASRRTRPTRDAKMENIRLLVSCYSSIAQAARNLGINRQQLNKYLNGSTEPSLRVLRRFSKAFGIPIEVIAGPLPELQRRIRTSNDRSAESQNLLSPESVSHIPNRLENIYGLYLKYSLSSALKDYVVCSLASIRNQHGNDYIKIYEHYETGGSVWGWHANSAHTGIINLSNERMIIRQLGGHDDIGLGMTVLYVNDGGDRPLLHGKQVGIFDFGVRPIFCANVVMLKIEPRTPLTRWLSNCGLLKISSVDEVILSHLVPV